MEYSIGDFSIISRLSIKTLRFYHEIRLLQPSRIEALTGYRYYDQNCLLRANAIQRLKALDFSLADIAVILDRQNSGLDVLSLLKTKQTEIENKIDTYHEINDRITYAIQIENAATAPIGEVVEKNIPDILIASQRYCGKYSQSGAFIEQLFASCHNTVAGYPFSLYYDDHPVDDGADIEVCLPIFEKRLDDQVSTRILPGGPFLSILHSGPYELIWRSYQKIVDYANVKQIKFEMPNRECYIRGANPADHYSTLEYLTEIQFPLT